MFGFSKKGEGNIHHQLHNSYEEMAEVLETEDKLIKANMGFKKGRNDRTREEAKIEDPDTVLSEENELIKFAQTTEAADSETIREKASKIARTNKRWRR